ncbi:MAG: DNA topoisomerase III, partial [Bacteroidaceae bacterium]|nr:DNA topoisomerase III [Bacteroidaceae bacterium]
TPTGVELIGLIREELLKSAELTGIWEKKLRQIERRDYEARTFLEELKTMVSDIVNTVLADNSNRRVTSTAAEQALPKKRTAKPKQQTLQPSDELIGKPCPLCGKGQIIKGKTAFGCSEWKSGCAFRLPFVE